MSTCGNYGNTGQLTCDFMMKIVKRPIFVPLYDSNGDATKIAEGSLTKTFLQGKFDEDNKADRFYPLPLLKNVTDERGDPVFFEWEGGGKEFIRENARAFMGHIKYPSPQQIGRLNEWKGKQFGAYFFDSDGNFIYNVASDGSADMYPIPMDGGSVHAAMMKATNSDPYMAALTFDTLDGVKDEDLRVVKESVLDFSGLSTTEVYGLSEVFVTITDAEAIGATLVLALDNGIAMSGVSITDLVANNDTLDTPVTLATVNESTTNPGTYGLTYSTGIAAGETLRITVSKTRLSHTYGTFVVTA